MDGRYYTYRCNKYAKQPWKLSNLDKLRCASNVFTIRLPNGNVVKADPANVFRCFVKTPRENLYICATPEAKKSLSYVISTLEKNVNKWKRRGAQMTASQLKTYKRSKDWTSRCNTHMVLKLLTKKGDEILRQTIANLRFEIGKKVSQQTHKPASHAALEVGESSSVGRRGGLSSHATFSVAVDSSNRAGNSEELSGEELGEAAGRRGAGQSASTFGSFVLSSSNRAGNSENL
jgi:hypothetical protein